MRTPTGWLGGADLLLGVGLPAENPIGGNYGVTPALQGQLRLGHELGRGGRWGRLEGVVAGFVTHPSGTSTWGLDSTYAVEGYGGARYSTPLFKYISFDTGLGYGGMVAVGEPTSTGAGGQTTTSALLPQVADGHGPVITAGFDAGFRWIGLVVEVDHFFASGQLTYVMAGIRFGR